MFQACYKSEEWDEDDLKSFTRMSTMHANIPDVIREVKGQVKIYNQLQSTCDVFQLGSIPSVDNLVKWKSELVADKKEGEHRYIEIEKELFDLDTVDQLLVIHRALDIKRQVKKDLIWFMSPPMKPTLMEKRPESNTSFQNLVFHEKVDKILDGYGMVSEQLAKVCCDHALSFPVIQWFLSKLNQMQPDVFCLCPQLEADTQVALCDLLEEGKQKPTTLVFIFNVERSEDGVTLRDESQSGSHFTLCHVNTLTNTVLYADSLGWHIPKELQETVTFYYQCIYGHSMPDFDVVYCHEPSSLSEENVHRCCQQCVTYYPLQRCQTICGVVVIILASIACLDNNLFLFLTTLQRYRNYSFISYLHDSTEYSKYLRCVLGTWLGDQLIDISYVTPKNFSKYQLVATFDPAVIEDLDFTPFHQLIVPVPGLIDLLLPENPTPTQKVHTTQEEFGTHWSGSGLEEFNEKTVRSSTRIATRRFQVPQITDTKEGNVVTYVEEKKVTDVYRHSEIPDQATLYNWQDQVEEALNNTAGECHTYVETEEDTYDQAALSNALQLHNVRQIQMEVQEELKWFTGYQVKPLAATKIPSRKSMNTFRSLIHNHRDDEVLSDYNMDAQELAQICCNRQICGKHIEWVVKKLNSMQSHVLCVYSSVGKSANPNTEALVDKSLTTMAIIFEVFRSNGVANFSKQHHTGCHFTICLVDLQSNKIIYGDSLGWPAPEDLQEYVSVKYQDTFKSPLPSMEVVLCHDTTFNTEMGEHICSPVCATYYPLQSCNALDGVICSIVLAIACLSPEYFKFLTVTQYNKMYTGSLALHMQYSSLHSNYLRRVLASWIADKRIDIAHIVPQGFDSFKQLAVPGSQVAAVVSKN